MNIDHIRKVEQSQVYMATMRPVFNKRALFTDTTEDYLSPAEPAPYDRVTIRFRTAWHNVDRVFLICKQQRYLMNRAESDGLFDYYTHELQLENEKVTYHFEVVTGKISGIYDVRGLARDEN